MTQNQGIYEPVSGDLWDSWALGMGLYWGLAGTSGGLGKTAAPRKRGLNAYWCEYLL